PHRRGTRHPRRVPRALPGLLPRRARPLPDRRGPRARPRRRRRRAGGLHRLPRPLPRLAARPRGARARPPPPWGPPARLSPHACAPASMHAPMSKLSVSLLTLALLAPLRAGAQDLLIPMDDAQSDHLKAYGAVYFALEQGIEVDWLLNYRGGSFLAPADAALADELRIRGVSFEPVDGAPIRAEVESPAVNMAVVRLEKAPKIAVYAPQQTLPWDDAVLLALTYAEVPYEQIYDGD